MTISNDVVEIYSGAIAVYGNSRSTQRSLSISMGVTGGVF